MPESITSDQVVGAAQDLAQAEFARGDPREKLWTPEKERGPEGGLWDPGRRPASGPPVRPRPVARLAPR
jgi:hypothetical protein